MPTLGLVQMAMGEDIRENFERAAEMVRRLGEEGTDIIALPEVFYARFFPAERDPRYWDWAVDVAHVEVRRFHQLAEEVDSVIILPIFERVRAGVYYNTALTIVPGGTVGRYRKTHVPLNPIFFEKYYFKPGNLGYPVVATPHGRVGTPICHDRHYPEVARAFALGGAEILIYPTAAHGQGPAFDVWELELRATAVANELYVAGVNRVGQEGALRYFGNSVVVAPDGRVLACAGEDETVIRVDIDLSRIEERRRQWHFFRDRRPETYGILSEMGDGETHG